MKADKEQSMWVLHPLGQLLKPSLANVKQDLGLNHRQFAQRFYVHTIYRLSWTVSWKHMK